MTDISANVLLAGLYSASNSLAYETGHDLESEVISHYFRSSQEYFDFHPGKWLIYFCNIYILKHQLSIKLVLDGAVTRRTLWTSHRHVLVLAQRASCWQVNWPQERLWWQQVGVVTHKTEPCTCSHKQGMAGHSVGKIAQQWVRETILLTQGIECI